MRALPPSTLLCAVAAGVALVALPGCGGGDDGGSQLSAADRRQLEQLSVEISRVSRTKDSAEFCALLQPSQVERRFGSEQRCAAEFKQVLAHSPKRPPLRVARMTATESGARVYYAGDGSPVDFVREGGRWYVAFDAGAGEARGGGQGG